MTEIINQFCGKCEKCKKLKTYKKVLKNHTKALDLEDMVRAKQVANAYINSSINGATKVLIIEETVKVPDYSDNKIARPAKLIDKKYTFYNLTDIQQGEFCVKKIQHPMMQDSTSWKNIKLFVMN